MGEPVRFDAGTNIREALERGERVLAVFRRLGLKCVDRRQELCVAADVETLADAARYHGIPLETLLAELNRDA
ncbi:MAG TPA: DUF1858 domain-containing protein [Planctomycetota bacterium]|jgi:hybrid cluster-associated redox disulfide protein|nr:DUF1858 domain-containing protein [Planctomycetota bacterium]